MVKNCIDMSNTWQPAGDKGKAKDEGKGMGKTQEIAQAKARAEDEGEDKSKACSKANQMRSVISKPGVPSLQRKQRKPTRHQKPTISVADSSS